MSIFQVVYQRRTCRLVVTILGADGTPEVLSDKGGDVVRVKIGRAGAAPTLDLSSESPTPNGSTVTASNPATVVLDEDDMTMMPGVYDLEVGVVDDDQDDAFKHAEKGTLAVLRSVE